MPKACTVFIWQMVLTSLAKFAAVRFLSVDCHPILWKANLQKLCSRQGVAGCAALLEAHLKYSAGCSTLLLLGDKSEGIAADMAAIRNYNAITRRSPGQGLEQCRCDERA